MRYKPSAADLQEHPGLRPSDLEVEVEPLLEDEDGEESGKKHVRNRSLTNGSQHTTDSLSSRGDLFPSEDEDDAVPLDDEFAMVLERRITDLGMEEVGGGKIKGKRPSRSR